MTVAEMMPAYEDTGSNRFDRTPPQDMEAEQCVLGAMLMSKDAIADVVEVLRGSDFYRPAHEQVYNAITELYGRGEPADAVTVSDELGKRGELVRVGGAPYLHTLLASVPIAANAGWYAEIVREKAILRRLVDASMRIDQMSYAAEGDVDVIVDRAQAEVYSVTERRSAEDYKPLSELMQPTLDEMEAIESRGAGLSGVPTGFADLDELTNGLHPGQMIIVAARPGCGKSLRSTRRFPLRRAGSPWLSPGRRPAHRADGRPTRVVAATDVMLDRPCFEVTFSDGTTVIADADHQWRASSRASRRAAAERRPPSYYFDRTLDRTADLAGCSVRRASPSVTSRWPISSPKSARSSAMSCTQCRARSDQPFEFEAVSAYDRRCRGDGSSIRVGDCSMPSRPDSVAPPIPGSPTSITPSSPRRDGGVGSARRRPSQLGRASDEPFELADAELPLAPYALGVWLGDGHSASARITSADPEIADHLAQCGLQVPREPASLTACGGRIPRWNRAIALSAASSSFQRASTFAPVAEPAGHALDSCQLRRLQMPGLPQALRRRSPLRTCRAITARPGGATTLGVLNNKHIPIELSACIRRRSVAICLPACSTPMAPSPRPAMSSSR